MTRLLLAALIVTTTLAGCSRLNPGTWLNSGGTAPRPDERARLTAPEEDTRVLIAEVTALEVTRTAGGAIIGATGVAPTQGWYQPGLVAQGVQDGTLTLEFRVAAPDGTQPVGSTQTREVIAAAAIDADTLAQTSRIVVRGETNALSSR